MRKPVTTVAVRCEVLAQLAQIEDLVDAAQQMAPGHVVTKVERVEEPFLRTTLLTHHGWYP